MRCLERQVKATQHNRRTKQHNTTRPRQLFFKLDSNPWPLSRQCSCSCTFTYFCVWAWASCCYIGVLHARCVCTWVSCGWEFSTLKLIVCSCLLVSHRCVSVLVRVWALDVWGEFVPLKIFNPLLPVLNAGHSVLSVWSELMGWVSFWNSCLAST